MLYSFRKNAVIQSSKIRAISASRFFILAGVFAGDKLEFWERRTQSVVSQERCKKLLEDSPWVKTSRDNLALDGNNSKFTAL